MSTAEGQRERRVVPVSSIVSGRFSCCAVLSRAPHTARLAGLCMPMIEDDLVEWDYGDYEA
jgi:hypothetical protein